MQSLAGESVRPWVNLTHGELELVAQVLENDRVTWGVNQLELSPLEQPLDLVSAPGNSIATGLMLRGLMSVDGGELTLSEDLATLMVLVETAPFVVRVRISSPTVAESWAILGLAEERALLANMGIQPAGAAFTPYEDSVQNFVKSLLDNGTGVSLALERVDREGSRQEVDVRVGDNSIEDSEGNPIALEELLSALFPA